MGGVELCSAYHGYEQNHLSVLDTSAGKATGGKITVAVVFAR